MTLMPTNDRLNSPPDEEDMPISDATDVSRSANARHPDYRADIDGLRAIAVIAVVGFHAFPNWIKGGFVGVDVFFVISGFLISGIIFRNTLNGGFSYRDFYARRIRRIFPSLLVVLLCSLLYGYHALFSTEFARMTGHIAAAAAFVANILLWHEVGYFDTDAAFKPMLHLWSLGVEEQYYILWPILVSSLLLKTRRFLLIILCLFALSFCANLVLVRHDQSAAFFLPVTRFWELMLGSGLAYLSIADRHSSIRINFLAKFQNAPLTRDLISLAGLGLVIGSIALIDSGDLFPGWLALFPTIGAALMIAAGSSAWVNRRLLSLRIMVFFGLISYPFYLWHWPILSFLHIDLGGELSRLVRILAVSASILLAWLTYQFVEKPIRFGAHGSWKIAGLVGSVAAVGICAPIAGHTLTGRDARDAYVAFFDNRPPDYQYGHTHNLFSLGREECNFLDIETNTARDKIADECTTPATDQTVLMWGDSHIQHLASGVRATVPASVSLLQIATSGCRPSIDDNSSDPSLACARSNQFARQTIAQVRPDVVILAQRTDHLDTDWNLFAKEIRALGAGSVILVGPVPQWNRDLYMIVARKYWPDMPEWISDGLLVKQQSDDFELSRLYKTSDELSYVSITGEMCGSQGCRAFVGPDQFEDIVTHDYGHFTTSASRYVAERTVTPVIRALIAKTQKD